MEPFIADFELISERNHDFRHVLYTTPRTQVVTMELGQGEEIGRERHDGDQIFLVADGDARFFIDGTVRDVVSCGIVVIPEGAWHKVTNIGEGKLRLVTVYAPPQHAPGTVQHTKADALREELQPA